MEAQKTAVQLFWDICGILGCIRWSWPLLDFINESVGFILPLDVSEMHLVCLTYSNHIAMTMNQHKAGTQLGACSFVVKCMICGRLWCRAMPQRAPRVLMHHKCDHP